MTALISTSELAMLLKNPAVKILDASWHMPAEKRDAKTEFLAEHIPGAAFFDLDVISDTQTDLPHMLPATEQFAQALSALGIRNSDKVVVYDTKGLFSAARAWWMLRVFGHDNVFVLNGGLPKWKAEGRAVVSGAPRIEKSQFHAVYLRELARALGDVNRNLTGKVEQMVDARSPARFSGAEADPRPGVRAGHIPGAKNVPYAACLLPDGTVKLASQLQAVFTQAGLELGKPITASCGSGVTACVLALALYEVGKSDVAIYDGSWAEWGRSELPIE